MMRTTWMARGLCAAVLTLVVVGFTAADDKDKKGGPPGGAPGGEKKGGFGPGKGFPPFGGKDFKKDFDPSKGPFGGAAFGKGPASVDLTQVSPETAVKILALVREDAAKKGGGEKKGTAEKKDDKVAPKTITIDLNKLPPDVARMIERAAERGKDEKKGDDKGRGRGKGPFGRPPE